MVADAALVFEKPHDGPGTHVLLLGIGAYDFLLGGKLASADVAQGMKQVPAAARSAEAMADFFLNEFSNPERPLASLALVVSDAEPPRSPHSLPQPGTPPLRGDIADVETAIHNWVQRGTAISGNLMILYFAGHGVSAGSSILLCRDYGKSAYNRFDGAINLNSLLVGLGTMHDGDQLVLVDACRSPDRIERMVRAQNGSVGRSILTPLVAEDENWAEPTQSVHLATSDQAQAWADPKSITIYSSVLIKALRGWGAQSRYGYWVGTTGLAEALDDFVPRVALEGGVKQVPDWLRAGRFKICLPPRAMTDIRISCEPDSVWATRMSLHIEGADFSDRHDHDPTTGRTRVWEVGVPASQYSLGVTFEVAGDWEDLKLPAQAVGPPAFPVVLRPKRRMP